MMEKNYSLNKEDSVYEKEYGIVKFINNYMKHYNHNDDWKKSIQKKTGLEVFEEFFHLFPYITGLAHQNIFLELRVVQTKWAGPLSLQGKSLYKIMKRKLASFSC